MIEYLDNIILKIQESNNKNDGNSKQLIEQKYINDLSSKYRIFDEIDSKMDDPRHKQMGYPLNKYIYNKITSCKTISW